MLTVIDECTLYLRGASGRLKPEDREELELCQLLLDCGATKQLPIEYLPWYRTEQTDGTE